MGNSSNTFSSDNHVRFLQNYLEDQIHKKRNKLGFSRDLHEKSQCNYLCCYTVEISFTKPVIILFYFHYNIVKWFKKKIKWKRKFLKECSLLRKDRENTEYEWTTFLPNFLANFEPIQSEDSYRTDLILMVFSSLSIQKLY